MRVAPAFAIRERRGDDLDRCTQIADEVRALDHYPSFIGDGGLRRFVDPDDALRSWVAVAGDEVVGMVALRPASAPPSATLAARELGVDEARLGFLARLEVAPGARRQGIARALVDTASAEARRLGRVPVLDVVVDDLAAIALFDAMGWHRLGRCELALRSGELLALLVFAAP